MKALLNAIRTKCPGQTECDDAIDILNDSINQLDQAMLATLTGGLQPNASSSLQVREGERERRERGREGGRGGRERGKEEGREEGEGGREGRREGGREGRREGGRERGREGGREGGRERGKEGGRKTEIAKLSYTCMWNFSVENFMSQ